MAKGFVIDVAKCTGCYACQIACKDEHVGNEWMPYAKEQPITGQFWCKVTEKERGHRPHVKVAYTPIIGAQTEAIREYAPEVCQEREDGLIVIDPVKAQGRKDLAEKFEGVYWNEELNIPQACTGCAHLLDDPNSPIKEPRCVGNCPVHAIEFGELSELDTEGCEVLRPEDEGKTHVLYRNLPKKFIAGTVYDPEAEEIIEGATVTAVSDKGTFTATTDNFGDFWLRQLPEAEWTVTIAAGGKEKVLSVSTMEEDKGLGDIPLA